MTNKTSPKEGGSDPAFFKGSFLIFLICMPCFIIVIAVLLLSMQYKQLRAFVSPNSMEMKTYPKSLDKESEITTRLNTFFREKSDTLILSSEDLNHWIRTSPTLEALHLDYHLDLVDTLIVARNSLSVDHLNGLLAFLSKTMHIRGYLNSEMKGYPSFDKEKISIIPLAATMNGQQAPVSVLNRKGGIEIGEWIENKALYNLAVSKLGKIQVRTGQLLLIKRS